MSDLKNEFYKKRREELKQADKEDKLLNHNRLKEKRKEKMNKMKKRAAKEIEEEDDDVSASEEDRPQKRSKKFVDSDSDIDNKADLNTESISVAEQEELALKLLSTLRP